MTKLTYKGCTIEQVRWGNNDDPRQVLEEGQVYQLEKKEEHKWHTKVKLQGIDGWYNSVCFDDTK